MAQGNLKRMTPEEHEAQVKYWEDIFRNTTFRPLTRWEKLARWIGRYVGW